jgi:transglutaminase-like putative cysteine protease/tetratricopeptide (TPR) repeat protein
MMNVASGRTHRLFSALILLAVLGHLWGGASLLRAQTSALDAPAFSTDAKSLLAAAQAVPKEKNANVILLRDDTRVVVDERGRAKVSTHMIFRVETAAGVEAWAEVSEDYSPWRQARPAIKARVITSDGVQHDLDPKTLTDNAVRDKSPQVYSDEHAYEGPLPAVAVGAVVEETIETEDTAPFCEGAWSAKYTIGREEPVLHSRLVVEAPASLPLKTKIQLLPEVRTDKAESNGKVVYTFENGRQDGLESEHMLPPDAPRYPAIALTSASSWGDLAARYSRRAEPQIRPDEVRSLVAGVQAGAPDAIAQLLARMHANARYTGLEFGEASITPQTPAETLKRKYGDCKDKAALLVSMLRAAGIPADLVLLNAGEGRDVEPDMPGLDHFNHAIVYIPGKDLFIDATANYMRVGELPSGDQGRWALVISGATTELKRIPELPSSTNGSVETREFFLSEYGPARVVETDQWRGDRESYYRSSYEAAENKESKKNLDAYAKSTYLADAVKKFEHGDVNDLSKPFSLRLEVDKAKRGNTDLTSAVTAIRIADMVSDQIPQEIRDEDKAEKSADGAKDESPKDDKDTTKPRTADWFLEEAFQTEWRYRVVPPLGFGARALPENSTTHFGPAVLTQEYRKTEGGVVEATLRFDLVKRRYTIAEVAELRKSLKQFREKGVLFLHFDLTANTLLEQGKVREALAEFRKLVAAHPREGLHRAQLAKAYLAAGLGERARSEAKQGVKLDPESAITQGVLGNVLSSDLFGRDHKHGWDPQGAVAAFRKAHQIDPKEPSYALAIGETLEFSPEGDRYIDKGNLDEAAKVYTELRKNEDANTEVVVEHLLFVCAYAERFKELRDLLANLDNRPLYNAMRLLATAGLDGADAAMKMSSEITHDEKARSDALATAGSIAMRIRMYPAAAEMLAAAAAGQSNGAAMSNLAQTLRSVVKQETIQYADDPAGLVMRAVAMATDASKRGDILKLLSRATFELPAGSADDIVRKQWNTHFGSEIPEKAMRDLTTAFMKGTFEGDDGSGYRVSIQIRGAKTQHVYVVKEDGAFKILCDSQDYGPLGQEVFDRIARNDLNGAKTLLDWVREDLKLAGGEDPYAGHAFPRVWNKNQPAEAGAERVAAMTLLASVPGAPTPFLASVEAVLEKASSDTERSRIDQALLVGYWDTKQWDKEEAAGLRLLAQNESSSVFRATASAMIAQKKWDEVSRLIAQHKGKLTDDEAATVMEAYNYLARGDPARAVETLKALVESGKGEATLVNQYGWASVIAGEVKPEAIQVVQQTVQQSKNQDYNILHTLGCMYAVAGRAAQARQTFLDALKFDRSGGEPESSIWFGFGLLAESYGENAAAVRLYRRVEKPSYFEPTERDTYTLAQRRLRALDPRGEIKNEQ